MHYRGPNVRPTSIFEAPFVQLLMRPGHFIFTLWRAGARRGVRTTAYRVVVLPAVLPDPDRFVPAYANSMRKLQTGERDGRAGRKPSEERFFQYTSAGANNRRKNNNCFYSRENTSPGIRTGIAARSIGKFRVPLRALLTKLKIR